MAELMELTDLPWRTLEDRIRTERMTVYQHPRDRRVRMIRARDLVRLTTVREGRRRAPGRRLSQRRHTA